MPYAPLSPSSGLEAFNRLLKILYFVLFATVGLYWMVLEMVAPGIEAADGSLLKTALLAVAGGTAAGVLYLRFSRIAPLLLDTSTELARRIPQLRLYYILCYTLSEAVALYGFVVRLLGGSRADAAPFFVGAVILFLLCYPRPPEVLTSRGR